MGATSQIHAGTWRTVALSGVFARRVVGNYSSDWRGLAWMMCGQWSYLARSMIDIDFISDERLRAVRDAVVLYRSIRAWDDHWGEYDLTEPVMICQLQSLPVALKVCQRLAADLPDPEFHWKDVKSMSDGDMTRLRCHMSLEREVRAYLKNLETAVK